MMNLQVPPLGYDSPVLLEESAPGAGPGRVDVHVEP